VIGYSMNIHVFPILPFFSEKPDDIICRLS